MLKPAPRVPFASLVLIAGRWRAGGVVAGTGAHGKFSSAAGRRYLHRHGPESSIVGGIGGVVGDRILIADIVGDLRANRFRVVRGFWKEGQAAGGVGQVAQR